MRLICTCIVASGLVSPDVYATADFPWDELAIEDALGTYQRNPIENPWHVGYIQVTNEQLGWLNAADVQWNLEDDMTNGQLLIGPDCPYYDENIENNFNLVLDTDDMGDPIPVILGFTFNNEFYERQPSNPAIDFLAPYGLVNFSAHYIAALETFVLAEQDYESGQYLNAKSRLDALWTMYPIGNDVWWSLPLKPFGINIGTPPCYYGLRMLTDMTDWRVENPKQEPAPRTVRLAVLIVGHTNGIEPQNLDDLKQGTGILVTHDLDPRIEPDGYAVVHESLRLFNEYVTTMTKGMLDVETYILSLPDVDLPVHAYMDSEGRYFATLENHSEIYEFLSDEVIEATDWWWILYPSHVPEQYPDFENAEFVTGGMGLGALASPFFISDDRWLVRKPPHIGEGEYSSLERGVYLPQWFQHEFYHHLYRTWPEFELEVTGHQWFDLANWPKDFEGQFEADYYHESLYKRLHFAEPPLHSGLRYSLIDAPWDQLTIDDVLGMYQREPVKNDWHIGDIQFSGSQLEWLNAAGVQWNLEADLVNGHLLTGPDCPYYGQYFGGDRFQVILQRDPMGDLTDEVRGYEFLSELYELQLCTADINSDGEVGVDEILVVIAAWGTDDADADVNNDGIVDTNDLLLVLSAWGPCP